MTEIEVRVGGVYVNRGGTVVKCTGKTNYSMWCYRILAEGDNAPSYWVDEKGRIGMFDSTYDLTHDLSEQAARTDLGPVTVTLSSETVSPDYDVHERVSLLTASITLGLMFCPGHVRPTMAITHKALHGWRELAARAEALPEFTRIASKHVVLKNVIACPPEKAVPLLLSLYAELRTRAEKTVFG